MDWQDLGDSVVNGESLSAADRSPGWRLPGKEFSRNDPGSRHAAAECGPAASSCGERRQLPRDPAGSRPGGGVHCFGGFGRLYLQNCLQC